MPRSFFPFSMSSHRSTRSPRAASAGLVTALAGAALILPAGAAGQACLGQATAPGQFALGGYGTFFDGGSGYGAESRSNLPGIASLGARIGILDLDDADEDLTSVGGDLALDLAPSSDIGICPVVGVEYDFWSGTVAGVDVDFSRLAVPLGLAVGTRVGAGDGIALIPAAQAGLMHQRFSGAASAGPLTFQRDGTRNDLYVDAGAALQIHRIQVTAGFVRIFEDDALTRFRVGLGILF